MKRNFFYKKNKVLILLLLLLGPGFYPKILAGSAGGDIQSRPLKEVLVDFEEQYKVFFNFQSALVEDKTVDFDFKNGERIEDAIDRLLFTTGLKYELFNEKYILLFQDTKQGKKDVNKIRRKINQIDKLERRGNMSLLRQQENPIDRALVLTYGYTELKADIQVTGTMTDDNGEPLIGATILLKGTTIGTVTDFDGKYTINVPDGSAVLVFSYTGYSLQEIEVGAQTIIDVVLAVDISQLEEIVVVGYGTARRKDIAGAVSTVRLEDSPLALSPNTNPLQSLQGGVAGVNIGTQNSPGTTPSIIVRGQNSINGSNDPLIVLDGIIYLGSIADINPEDIAVIDILKDASAAAVYGSRAANGVIVITTKKGKSDKPRIIYNSSISSRTLFVVKNLE